MIEQSGECGRRRAFHHELLFFQKEVDRPLDGGIRNEDDVCDELAGDLERHVADRLHGDAFGQRLAPVDRLESGERALQRRIGLRLNADDLQVGLEMLRGHRASRNQAAAADRNEQNVEIGDVVQKFEPRGALSGDDERIVVRMNEREPFGRRDLMSASGGIRQRIARQNHARTELFGASNFRERRRPRHHDRRRNAEPAALIRDGLRVISGRHRDDALRALGVRKYEHAVCRAAVLERARPLTRLELERNARVTARGERARKKCRRAHDVLGDALRGSRHVVVGNRKGHWTWLRRSRASSGCAAL